MLFPAGMEIVHANLSRRQKFLTLQIGIASKMDGWQEDEPKPD
ncbi:MAG: hypothetical protein ACLVL2_03620 [Bacteroides cellulosilyticus]